MESAQEAETTAAAAPEAPPPEAPADAAVEPPPENVPVTAPKLMFKGREAVLPKLSAAAKRELYRALDFAARREGIAGEPLEQAVEELRFALGE